MSPPHAGVELQRTSPEPSCTRRCSAGSTKSRVSSPTESAQGPEDGAAVTRELVGAGARAARCRCRRTTTRRRQGYAARAVGPARPVRIGVAEVAGVAGFLGVVRVAAAAGGAEARGDGVSCTRRWCRRCRFTAALSLQAFALSAAHAQFSFSMPSQSASSPVTRRESAASGVISPSRSSPDVAVQVTFRLAGNCRRPCRSRAWCPGLQLQPSFRLPLQSESSPATSQSSLGLGATAPDTRSSCRPPGRSAHRPCTCLRGSWAGCPAVGHPPRSPAVLLSLARRRLALAPRQGHLIAAAGSRSEPRARAVCRSWR